ncbi:MAG TPA: serine/threonine-protein kinase [Planctomycetota bacterium]|nr:serine/threonine-protein kinase [Planctomycetota bacterium]
MSDRSPSKPGSATAAVTPPAGVSGSTTAATPRSITRTSCSGTDKLIGRSVGKARILKRLGRGGMGDVYLCQHPDYDKAIAIKVLPSDLTRNDELLQRFRREADSAARLDDPNLVEIYDIGEENGVHFILMAYVDGLNLQELLDDQGKLDFKEAARIAYEVALGLQAVHRENIIHRDIKPANILISTTKDVKIVDFGLAYDAEDKTTLTVAGAVMGTPWYLSPEQAEGRRADARSDIYSLGVCLYMMVCGVRPFLGESHMAVLYKQIHERPRDPRFHRPDIPDHLADLILKALEKKPERRFQSSVEICRALDVFIRDAYPRKVLAALPPAAPVRPAEPVAAAVPEAPRVRSPFISFAFAGWVIVVLATVLSIFFVSSRPPAPAPAADPQDEPAPAVDPVEPAVFAGLLTDADQRQIAERNYGPVIKRLMERHQSEHSAPVKALLSRVGLKLSSAAKVASQYRTLVSADKAPTIKLRDGRISAYALTPLASVHADTIVDYARRSREVGPLDLAFFLIVDGEAKTALDHVFSGREIRPDCRPHLDDLVESMLAQKHDAREIAERLAALKDRLPAAPAARVDAALKK